MNSRKRLIFALALVMLFGMFPGIGLSARAESNTVQITENTAGHGASMTVVKTITTPHSDHDDIVFTQWGNDEVFAAYNDNAKTDANCLPPTAGNYYLANNVTLTETWVVPDGVTNLCLNGKDLTALGEITVISVGPNAVLNIYNHDDSKDLPNMYHWDGSKGLITHTGEGDVYATAISVQGTLNLYDGYISGNKTGDNGGSVVVGANGVFTMSGGSITGNYTTSDGAGVRVAENGTFIMTGGSISGNSASMGGGGVRVDAGGKFTMTGGSISGNSVSMDYGGGVLVDAGGEFIMSGGDINGNIAPVGGGVMIREGGSFTINGGSITGNQGVSKGGAVCVLGDMYISGNPVIYGNMGSHTGDDGVVSKVSSDLLITGAKITLTGALTYEGSIGVMMGVPGVFTSGWSTYMGDRNLEDFFHCDKGGTYFVMEDGEAKLIDKFIAPDGSYYITTPDMGLGSAEITVNGEVVAYAPVGETVSVALSPKSGYKAVGLAVMDKVTIDPSFEQDVYGYEVYGAIGNDVFYLNGIQNESSPYLQYDEASMCLKLKADGEQVESWWKGYYDTEPMSWFKRGYFYPYLRLSLGNEKVDGIYLPARDTYPTVKVNSRQYTFTMPENDVDVCAVYKWIGSSGHTHGFVYSASGDTITATCVVNDCPLPDQTATLTIAAPALTSYGSAKSPQAIITDEEDIQASAVVYYRADDAGEKTGSALPGAPTDIGKYWAEVTAGTGRFAVTAHVVYEIGEFVLDYNDLIPTGSDNETALAAKQVNFNGMAWYVIQHDAGTVTLLAKSPIAESSFSDSENSDYASSNVRAYLDDLTAEGGTFADVADCIDGTDLNDVGVTGAKLYLLSHTEAGKLPGQLRLSGFDWWLRTRDQNYDGFVKAVHLFMGEINSEYVSFCLSIRPALRLNLSKVAFDASTNSFTVRPPHDHSFSDWSASGSTITATCTADGCYLTNGKATLTIAAPALTNEGGTESPEAIITDEEGLRGGAAVAYYKANAAGTAKTGSALTAVPTKAGKYWAEITLGDGDNAATAHVVYEIGSFNYASLSPTVFSATRVTFNGMDWYVIRYVGETLTLLACDPIAESTFSDSGSTAYARSNVKAYLDGLTAAGGSFADVADCISATDLSDVGVTGAKLYLLSDSDLSETDAGYMPYDAMTCTPVKNGEYWWLRTASWENGIIMGVACYGGYVDYYSCSANSTQNIRPALRLDLSKVAFDASTNTFTAKPTHEHSFAYTADGNTIAQICTADGCDLTDLPTLTIAAPALTVYGGAESPEAIITDADGLRGDAEVVYFAANDAGEKTGDALTAAPINAGKYRAEITLGEGDDAATAHVVYTIEKADPIANAPTGLTATYGQTLADVTLTNPEGNTEGVWAWADDTLSVGEAGENTFQATFTPTDANYSAVEDVDVTVTVTAPTFGTPNFKLPKKIKTVEESAFEGDTSITVAEIPTGCQSIGANAFKDCAGLTQIRIPASVTSIDTTAFDGCENVLVFGAAGSAAEAFCGTHANCTFVAENAGE